MSNKKIVLILFLLVILPALFYTVYEISIYNENENAVTQIYDQKLSSILFSINQYYWDTSQRVKLDFVHELLNTTGPTSKKLASSLKKIPGLNAVFIADSLMSDFKLSVNPDSAFTYTSSQLQDSIIRKGNVVKRLFHRRKIGYSKIEPILLHLEGDQKLVGFLFIIEQGNFRDHVGGLIFNAQTFASSKLLEKVPDFSDQEVIIGVFHKSNSEPVMSIGDISLKNARIIRKLWLIPEYLIGIKTVKGKTISDLLRNRFRRSLLLILLMDIILLISALILYRAVRKEMELARMKTDFVSNVSHELRTPLSLIRMFSESLEMGRVPTDDKKMEYYKIITQETLRLTHLINNILDFSKMEAGKKKLTFQEMDLNRVVKECVNSYRFHLDNEGYTLKINFEPGELNVSVDKEMLTEAIINLLDNAVKYSGDKKNISVLTGKENEFAFVEIKDSGIGISDSDQKYIFDKFYRVSDGLTHNVKGSGLGLSLVKYTVQAHNGNIVVFSQKGKGSQFRIRLPLIEEQDK